MNNEDKESTVFSIALLKHSKDFLSGFLASSLFVGVFLALLITDRWQGYFTIVWMIPRVMLMGLAGGIGWMIGKWPLSPELRKRFLTVSSLIGVGILLLLAFLVVYLKLGRF